MIENIIVIIGVSAFLVFSYLGLRAQSNATDTFDSNEDEQKPPEKANNIRPSSDSDKKRRM